MSWKTAAAKHSEPLTQNNYLAALAADLQAAEAPPIITPDYEHLAAAQAEAGKAALLASGKIEVLAALPWLDGAPSGEKGSNNFYLSGADAVNALAEKLGQAGWSDAIIFLTAADNYATLHSELEKINAMLGAPEVARAARTAAEYANHEGRKRQLERLPERPAKIMESQIRFFAEQSPAASAIEVARAASAGMADFSEFMQARAARALQLKQDVEALRAASFSVTHAAHFAGSIPEENPAAQSAIAAAFALRGDIEKLKEALDL